MGKSKKEANKDYYCKKLDEFSLTRSPSRKNAWGWQEYEGNDQSDAGERADRHSSFPSNNASVFWSNKKAMGWDRGFWRPSPVEILVKRQAWNWAKKKKTNNTNWTLDLLTSRAFERVARLWARSAIVRARSASELDMCAEWRTPLILYLRATYYILQNICQFISHSICLEVWITGYNLNANNGRMSYLYHLFKFTEEDSPSTFFRGLSLYISNLTN